VQRQTVWLVEPLGLDRLHCGHPVTPAFSAAVQVVVGGLLVLATGILIGSSKPSLSLACIFLLCPEGPQPQRLAPIKCLTLSLHWKSGVVAWKRTKLRYLHIYQLYREMIRVLSGPGLDSQLTVYVSITSIRFRR
jgi:hypothetical protein